MTATTVIRQLRNLLDVDWSTVADGEALVYNSTTDKIEGAAGAGGSDVAYTFTQSTPSATWNVAHGLGKFPSVTVVDTGGTVVIPDVLYTDTNNLVISFLAATTGKVYLN